MPVSNVWLRVDGQNAAAVLEQAIATFDEAGSDPVLDFSSVKRIDARSLKAIEELADKADKKAVKVALYGVNPAAYKAIKLMKLSPRFSFLH